MGTHNDPATMKKLKKEYGEELIPDGIYCYDGKGNCPYWDKETDKPEQWNGYCWFMEKGDWENNDEMILTDVATGKEESPKEMGIPCSLLWDQCKECGIKTEDEEYEFDD